MTKKDFVRKITSRKFWVAVVAFVVAILTAFNVPDASVSQITAIIMAFGSLIAYMFAEGWADASRTSSGTGNTFNTTYNWPDGEEETIHDSTSNH